MSDALNTSVQELSSEEADRTVLTFVTDESVLPTLTYFAYGMVGSSFDEAGEISADIINQTDLLMYNRLLSRNSKPKTMKIYINRSIRAVVTFGSVRTGTTFGYKPDELVDTNKFLVGAFTSGSINFTLSVTS